jgi:hypothetical protein
VRVHLLQGDPRLNLSIAGNEPDRLSLSGYLVTIQEPRVVLWAVDCVGGCGIALP